MMRRFTKLSGVTFLAAAGWLGPGGPEALAAGPDRPAGVEVEEVGEGSALANAGIEPGDVLTAWRRPTSPPDNPEEARGALRSFFDWKELVGEEAPRGTVEVSGFREGRRRAFTVAPGSWEAEVRPPMPPAVREAYLRGWDALRAGDATRAARSWEESSAALGAQAEWTLKSWWLLRLAKLRADEGEWAEAHATLRSALAAAREPRARAVVWQELGTAAQNQGELEVARRAFDSAREMREAGPESLGLAESLHGLGNVAWRQADLKRAEELYRRALEIRRKLAPRSLDVASTLRNLGTVARRRGESERAAELFHRGLEIQQELAPQGLEVAVSLHNLAILAHAGGDLDRAAQLFGRTLEIKEKLAPESLTTATSLAALGYVTFEQGDFERATELCERALEIQRRRVPGSSHEANSLIYLGLVAWRRGDLDRAAELYQDALEIEQKLAPESPGVALILNNLATVAWGRKDSERAARYLERALAIHEKKTAESEHVASVLGNLGVLAQERGELQRATDLFLRALKIQQKVAPDGFDVAISLLNLGETARLRGDLPEAQDLLERALAIRRKVAPDSLYEALTLHSLGVTAHQRDDPDGAKDLLERALALQQELAPGSEAVVKSLHALGLLYRRTDPALADDFFRRSLDTLESQISRLGGSHEIRSGFRAQFHDIYRHALEVELELERPETAFHTLERSRARGFLDQLAERDTVFTAEIPAELDRERRRLAARFDRTLEGLAGLRLRDPSAAIDELHDELRRLRDEARDVEEKIRRASPRLAALHYPRPLDVEAARSSLDSGTLMLSYSVGEESTVLFAASREHPLRVERLEIGEAMLRRQVEGFRELIREVRSPGSPRRDSLVTFARRLHDTLIEPVADLVESSDRLLILADGPLHTLPWGALRRGTGEYLIAWKPLHSVLSATVYAELRKLRRSDDESRPPVRVAAFGDPRFPGSRERALGRGDAVVRSVAERGLFDWEPLPATRHEVEAITGVFSQEGVRAFLGAEATEERAKALGPAVSIVHFATHAYLDERLPMNSFLALSIPESFDPGRDNGLLQAWEVFERVRIDADLVVLSACGSGIGLEQRGEGLMGLTRAFQYAGARSVMASLWNVADLTTAELMVRFYRHLRSGEPKDEALRSAQVELIRGPIRIRSEGREDREVDASAPFYWAAFQIYGDWQ